MKAFLRVIRRKLHHQAFFSSAVTTVEGILQRTISGLEQDQPLRKALDPDSAEKIEEYIAKVRGLMELEEPFHLVRPRGHCSRQRKAPNQIGCQSVAVLAVCTPSFPPPPFTVFTTPLSLSPSLANCCLGLNCVVVVVHGKCGCCAAPTATASRHERERESAHYFFIAPLPSRPGLGIDGKELLQAI